MRNLILLLLIAVQFSCNEQMLQRDIESAQEQITSLKEGGALVVRLRRQDRKISKLKEKGFDAKAKIVSEEASVLNKELMAAFKAEFNFCPVYFIDERGTEAIRAGETKKNVFLDDNLEIDESIICEAKYILTAEFGETVNSRDDNFESQVLHKGDRGSEMRNTYQGSSSEVAVTGLIMKTAKFAQLRRPFPFYVREYTTIVLSRGKYEMVGILNKNLQKFYESQK